MDFAERVLESGILHRQTDRQCRCVDACTHAAYPPSNPDAKCFQSPPTRTGMFALRMPDLLEMVENRLGLRKSGGADILRGQKPLHLMSGLSKFSCY